jgi:hypothetical protein
MLIARPFPSRRNQIADVDLAVISAIRLERPSPQPQARQPRPGATDTKEADQEAAAYCNG